MLITQVVPNASDDSVPIVSDYQDDLKDIDWSASAGFGDLEGYIAARILTLALQNIEGPPTREAVVDALEGLGNFDIGLGETLYLSRPPRQLPRPSPMVRSAISNSTLNRRPISSTS
jgi:branched-chain amino acid transport system substrate-binding protein